MGNGGAIFDSRRAQHPGGSGAPIMLYTAVCACDGDGWFGVFAGVILKGEPGDVVDTIISFAFRYDVMLVVTYCQSPVVAPVGCQTRTSLLCQQEP